jgi:hypothetical protein
MLNNYCEIKLPQDLCRQIEAKYVGTHFATLEEVLTFVLRELVRDDALELDAEEERIIEQRLRDLGYF